VFQCLLIGGENVGPDAKRNAETFVISEEQFDSFIQRHKSVSQLVPESNTTMKDSYLILDEYVSYTLLSYFRIMNHYLVETKKVVGMNHKVNSPKINHNFPWGSIG